MVDIKLLANILFWASFNMWIVYIVFSNKNFMYFIQSVSLILGIALIIGAFIYNTSILFSILILVFLILKTMFEIGMTSLKGYLGIHFVILLFLHIVSVLLYVYFGNYV